MLWLCETAGGRWICWAEARAVHPKNMQNVTIRKLTLGMTNLLANPSYIGGRQPKNLSGIMARMRRLDNRVQRRGGHLGS
jgi:hypothetical protein